MHKSLMHGNREIPEVTDHGPRIGPVGEDIRRTPDRYAFGKSDTGIVSRIWMNKGTQPKGHPPAESVERRPVAKGNPEETTAAETQSSDPATSALDRVREAARRDATQQFTNLLHHIDVALLRQSYRALQRDAAAGIDAVTWKDYGVDLDQRLADLQDRIHTGRYRARASKRYWIPKTDGRKRPIGITSLEDKIVQRALVLVLQQIYEEDFKSFSYGFRPGRSAHDALDAIYVAITQRKVNWVLDADISSFFDSMSHSWLLRFLAHRVQDPRILRLVRKFLRAGVSEEGQWSKTEVGTPQGAVISPLLANIYLHYVLDLWAHKWRREHARGEVYIVRYADDFVMGFQYRSDAERFERELKARLASFDLALHKEKTRVLEFGRYAATNRANRGQGRPETFDFLGFTHYCARTRKDGSFALRRRTIGKRMRTKLKEVGITLRRMMHLPLPVQRSWVASVLRGYYRYYGVPGNLEMLSAFRKNVLRIWLRTLRRRSQKGRRLTWERFNRRTEAWLPKIRVMHPYPNQRLCVRPKAGAV